MVDGELDKIIIYVSYPQNMSVTAKVFLSNVTDRHNTMVLR